MKLSTSAKRKARKAKLHGKEPGAPLSVTFDEGLEIENDVSAQAVVDQIELQSPETIKSIASEVSLDHEASPPNEAEVHQTGRSSTVTHDEEGWQEVVPRARSSGVNKSRPAHGSLGQDHVPSQKGPSTYRRSRASGNTGGDYSRGGRSGAGPNGNKHSTAQSQRPRSGNQAGKSSLGEMSGASAARRTPTAPSQGVTSTKTALVQVISSAVMESTLEKQANENIDSPKLAAVAQLPAPFVRQPSIKFSKTGVPAGKGSFSFKEVLAPNSRESMLQLKASAVPDVEGADHKKDVSEMTSSNASPIPSSNSAEVGHEEVEPDERIIETVEPSAPLETQSVETPLQVSIRELSNGSVRVEFKILDCRTVVEEQTLSVFVTNASDGAGSEGNAKVDSTRLSAAAPPFYPGNDVRFPIEVSLPVPRPVAVTAFIEGRSPPVGGPRPVQISVLPVQVPPTIATITTICKVTGDPTLAPNFQYEPYMGVMNGMMLPPFQDPLPQAPLQEGHHPLVRPVPSPVMMGTKKMNPYAEEFIPSSLRK